MTDRTPEQIAADKTAHVHAEVDSIATRLERVAAQIRHANSMRGRVNLYDGKPDHTDLARQVMRLVASMNGNMRLDDLLLAAADADRVTLGFGEAFEG